MEQVRSLLILLCSLPLIPGLPGQPGTTVVFPRFSEPIQITDSGKEHFFASYYGINSFSQSEQYVTVLETDLKYRLPDEKDPATLGLVDWKARRFIPLAQTRAWNFQEGCMAHWLGSSPDALVIYNDFRDGRYVSVILDVHRRKEVNVFPYPVSAVSPDGTQAVSINFSRMRITRPDYGYGGGGQDARKNVPLPADDGLFLLDLRTGKARLLVSMDQVKDRIPPVPAQGIEYFCHTRFSREGTKIFWLARSIPDWNTTAFTVRTDGSDLRRCFPDQWGGSHFDWLNDRELMVTARYEGKQDAHILFTVGEQDFRRLGNGLLDYDGHGTFSPDGKWMVTDTYPSQALREQKIYLMDMRTEAVLPLGRFREPAEFNGFWRCDLHCRWSPRGDLIGFNSTRSGSRQVYIFQRLDP